MNNDQDTRPGHKAPDGYDPAAYDRPSVACDVVIVIFRERKLRVLLIERKHDPYAGYWALPGGFVEIDEALETAAAREVFEETGIKGLDLIPLGAFGDPGRDPRTRVISSAYLALALADELEPQAGDDAKNCQWFPLSGLPELAFDHGKIIAVARERLIEASMFSPRVFDLLPEPFAARDFFDLAGDLTGKELDRQVFFTSLEHVPGFRGEERNGELYYRYDRNSFHVGDFLFLVLGR